MHGCSDLFSGFSFEEEDEESLLPVGQGLDRKRENVFARQSLFYWLAATGLGRLVLPPLNVMKALQEQDKHPQNNHCGKQDDYQPFTVHYQKIIVTDKGNKREMAFK